MNEKIVFIIEGKHHLEYLPAMLKKHRCFYAVTGGFSDEKTMVAKAQEMIEEGTKVIISSGGYYNVLVRSVDVPIVQVTRTWAGIPQAVAEARKISERTAILAKTGVFQIAGEQYRAKHADDIRIEQFTEDEECVRKLKMLKEEGYEALVCGSRGSRLAEEMGFQVITVPFEEADVVHAVEEAEHVLSYLETIERTGSMLKTIQNSVSSAIIATDASHHITEINNAALNMLAESRSRLSGKKLEDTDLAPVAELENYQTNSAASGLLVTIRNTLMSVSLIPVSGNNEMTVITLEKTSGKHADEKKRESRDKGHRAAYHFEQIVGSSPALMNAVNTARKYARVDSSILISAPTGCGKEMFAQSIHNASRRRNMPFVVVNCAALPESLLESILFGYEKGAYTGAAKEGRQGLFLLADGGTVFLDEISEMPLTLQSRFLRVLQEKEITPLGSDRVIPVDVRVLAATNRNLYEMVEKGSFRNDLFFRLAVLELSIPSLNERREDIPQLVRHFLYTHAQTLSLPCPEIEKEALDYMETLEFPGNVRQLENFVERLLVLHEGNRPVDILLIKAAASGFQTAQIREEEEEDREEIERKEIMEALRRTKGSRHDAAELLGISTTTLWRKIRKYGIRL